MQLAVESAGETRACIGSEHGRRAERDGSAQCYVPFAPVLDRAHECGTADHGEAHGDGALGVEPQRVDEHWHGEDGPAAAEESEGEADDEREERGDD